MKGLVLIQLLLKYLLDKTTKITKEIQTENDIKIEIDVKALMKVLKQPQYAKYPVAVYSIIGPFRSGKSFLLSCWTHFVKHLTVSKTEFIQLCFNV